MVCKLYFNKTVVLKNYTELSFLRFQMGKTKQPCGFIHNSVGQLGDSGLSWFSWSLLGSAILLTGQLEAGWSRMTSCLQLGKLSFRCLSAPHVFSSSSGLAWAYSCGGLRVPKEKMRVSYKALGLFKSLPALYLLCHWLSKSYGQIQIQSLYKVTLQSDGQYKWLFAAIYLTKGEVTGQITCRARMLVLTLLSTMPYTEGCF